MKLFFLLVLSALFAGELHAQQSVGSILGQIQLTSSDQAQNLRVRAEEATTETRIEETEVDSSGSFALRNLPYATYDIYLVQENHSVFNRRIRVNSAVPITIRIDSLPNFSGQEVTVTDSHVETSQPTVHTLFTSPIIQSLPVTNPQKQVEAILLNSPGVVPDEDGRMHMRGEDAMIQYVIDGIPITMSQARINTPLFSGNMIETADLLRGSLNPEYGVATSGILNITTRSGFDAPTLAAGAYSIGSQNNHSESADLGGHFGQAFAYYASYGNFSSDRYLDPISGFDPLHTAGHGNDYFGKINIIATDQLDITALGYYAETHYQIPNRSTQSTQDQNQDLRNVMFGGRVNYSLTPSSVISLLGYTRTQEADISSNGMNALTSAASDSLAVLRNEKYFIGGRRNNIESGGQLDYSMKTNWFNDENQFKLGVGGEIFPLSEYLSFAVTNPNISDSTQSGGDARLAPYDLTKGGHPFVVDTAATGKRFSGYAQDVLNAGNWTIAGGLRFDYYELLDKESGLSPRLNVVYRASDDLVLRGSYNRMFMQAPLENILVSSSAAAAQLVGSKQIGISQIVQSEKSHVVELGAGYQLSKYVNLDLTGYGKLIDNFVVKVELGNSGVIFPANIKNGVVAGGELSVSLRDWNHFSGNLALATTMSKGVVPSDGTTPFAAGLVLGEEGMSYTHPWSGENMFNTEHNQLLTASFTLRYDHPAGFFILLGGRFDSGLPFDLANANGVGLDATQSRVELKRRGYSDDVINLLNLNSDLPGSPDKSVAAHATFDLSAGASLERLIGFPVRITGTVINILDTKYLYKFESSFGGTHFGTPRMFLARADLVY